MRMSPCSKVHYVPMNISGLVKRDKLSYCSICKAFRERTEGGEKTILLIFQFTCTLQISELVNVLQNFRTKSCKEKLKLYIF